MTAIWYSDADDRIVIEGALQTYAPRTLMAVVTDAGISVRLKVRTTNEFGPFAFDDLTDAAGDRFTSTDAALAYLNGVFARKPAIGEIFGIATVCEADILRGQPVVVSRATGRLLPARADIYPLALVVGLAEADTAEGFTLRPARGAVTLDDWSVVLGAPTLAPGLISKDRSSALIIATLDGGEAEAPAHAKEVASRFEGARDGITVRVGGQGMVFQQVNEQTTRDLAVAEAIAIPISFLVLIVVFGGVIAAMLPIGVGIIAIVLTFALLRLIGTATDV